MLKMVDSGIDSDSKSTSYCTGGGSKIFAGPSVTSCIDVDIDEPNSPRRFNREEKESEVFSEVCWDASENDCSAKEHNSAPKARLISTSQLQKRLEKQILQAKRIRLKEQNAASDGVPKKLIPRSRLKVPKGTQVPTVTKADSHPLVSWESEDSDDEFDFLPGSKTATREITQQLIKDGYNLDLTPDDEDLDLIPPKALNSRCICCGSVSSMCLIQ